MLRSLAPWFLVAVGAFFSLHGCATASQSGGDAVDRTVPGEAGSDAVSRVDSPAMGDSVTSEAAAEDVPADIAGNDATDIVHDAPTEAGCGADTNTDVDNCGSCGNVCPTPANAAPSCTRGVCGLGLCNTGFGDCDALASTGCETNLDTDTRNCGLCSHVCAVPASATAGCSSGTCGIGSCSAGYADCNHDPSDGCEVNTASSIANCGTCAHACGAGMTCSSGTCASSCLPPTMYCSATGTCASVDSDNSNCGTCGHVCSAGTSCTGGSCVSVCGGSSTYCPTEMTCANLTSDNSNCGMCGHVCGAGTTCSASACVSVCASGSTYCAASMLCANLMSDNTNCGSCGNVCGAGTHCVAGACASICSAGQTYCAALGACENLSTDNNNCGSCSHMCGAGTACSGGVCNSICSAGQTYCAALGACENLSTDNNNCGSCSHVCTAGTACSGGVCNSICSAGQTYCAASAACENLLSDNNNCGSCGHLCTAGTACSGGVCNSICSAGTTYCSGTASCANLLTDNANCGSCGHACTGANTCMAGVCALTCASGLTFCAASDTCENLQTEANNCGGCGVVCPAGDSCVAAACVAAPPNDHCSGATVLSLASETFTIAATTTNAAHDLNAPCATSGADVWYQFTLPQPEIVYADTIGSSVDTILFFANNCTTPTPVTPFVTGGLIECDDDLVEAGCTAGTLQSQVAGYFQAGTYYLVLSGFSTASGASTIHFQHIPTGNDGSAAAPYATPLVLPAGASTQSGTTGAAGLVTGATVGLPACYTTGGGTGGNGNGAENTYFWRSCPEYAGGSFSATTCTAGTTFDTVIYVASPSGATAVGDCDDDNGACGSAGFGIPTFTSILPHPLGAAVSIPAGAGLHALYIDGYGTAVGEFGAFSVNVNRP